MMFVIAIYIIFSIATFSLGNPDIGFGANAIIASLYPNQASWLPTLVSVTIIISIMSGLSGNTVNASRQLSSLSEENEIVDKNGFLIQRDKSTLPVGSM
jgi:amino acid transporter